MFLVDIPKKLREEISKRTAIFFSKYRNLEKSDFHVLLQTMIIFFCRTMKLTENMRHYGANNS